MTLGSALAIGGGIIVFAVLGTQLLPRHVTVERSAQVQAAPEAVIALLASNEGYQKINPYLHADPDLKISLFGPAQGVGSGFHFDGKEGKGSQRVAALSAHSVTYDIDLGAMGRPQQIVDVQANGDGSSVSWRMEADLGKNPIARIFGLFMDGMIGKTLDQALTNLNTAA